MWTCNRVVYLSYSYSEFQIAISHYSILLGSNLIWFKDNMETNYLHTKLENIVCNFWVLQVENKFHNRFSTLPTFHIGKDSFIVALNVIISVNAGFSSFSSFDLSANRSAGSRPEHCLIVMSHHSAILFMAHCSCRNSSTLWFLNTNNV